MTLVFDADHPLMLFLIIPDSIAIQLVCWHKPIVTFIDDADFVVLQSQLEQGHNPPVHELRRDCTTTNARKFLRDETNVLSGLNNADLIVAALRLNRDDVMATPLVEPDVKLIDLDLSDAFDGRAKVVLEAVCGEAQEGVD